MASQLFPLCDQPWLLITSCFFTVQTNPYGNKKLVLSARPDKLNVEASSISQEKTRTAHRLSSHMASSLEDQCRSGEITEETQWQCCGLVYDGGAPGGSISERRGRGRWVSWDEESQAGQSSQTGVMVLATALRDSDHLSHRLFCCRLGWILLDRERITVINYEEFQTKWHLILHKLQIKQVFQRMSSSLSAQLTTYNIFTGWSQYIFFYY